MANRLNAHINRSKLSKIMIGLFTKPLTQPETALLKIHNDILSLMDNGKVTVLTLLDLSAAFDTIDHTILLRRLNEWFGVTEQVLDWFKSYLTGKCRRIKLCDSVLQIRFHFRSPSRVSVRSSAFYTLYHSTSVAWFLDTLSLTTSMLMIASCMFHFHQVTLLHHWMAYNCA